MNYENSSRWYRLPMVKLINKIRFEWDLTPKQHDFLMGVLDFQTKVGGITERQRNSVVKTAKGFGLDIRRDCKELSPAEIRELQIGR